MDYEIDYEERHLEIIVKAVPIIISQIQAGNPFRPRFKDEQMNLKFFQKQVNKCWNTITNKDLTMELQEIDVWAELFVDFLMDSYSGNEEKKKKKKENAQKHQESEEISITTTAQEKDKKETKTAEIETSVKVTSQYNTESGFTGSSLIPKTGLPVQKLATTEDIKPEIMMATQAIAQTEDKNQNFTPAADNKNHQSTKGTKWSLRRILSYICPCLKAKNKENDY